MSSFIVLDFDTALSLAPAEGILVARSAKTSQEKGEAQLTGHSIAVLGVRPAPGCTGHEAG